MNELAKYIYSAVVEKNNGEVQLPLEQREVVNDLQDLITTPPGEVAEHLKRGARPDPWPTFRLGEPVPTPNS